MADTERVAIYARVSTAEQADTGRGLDVQLAQCRQYCDARGWQIIAEYIDDGVSGTRTDRPAWTALREAAGSGMFDVLLTQDTTRLARSLVGGLALAYDLAETGVSLYTLDGIIDTVSADGRAMLAFRLTMAQWQRDILVAKTTAGRDARGMVDGERGGRLPFGYRRVMRNGRAVGVRIDPEAAETVRRIFREREAGASLASIADGLNSDGVPTALGGSWYPATVSGILKRERTYRGGTRWQSSTRWPAVLAEAAVAV